MSYGHGAAAAPEAILKASYYQEFYDDELNIETYKCGIHTLPVIKPCKSPKEMIDRVEQVADSVIADGKIPFMLGGEHSISFGLYKALHKKYPDIGVVQIDAHADLRDSYEGTKYSHAAVMRRIRETCQHTTQIGIRSLCREEADYIKQHKASVYLAKDIHNNNGWIDKMVKQLPEDIFITFDIDGLDPSIVPHTGTPEPGGLLWYETLEILKRIFKEKNVVGIDLVELASDNTSRNSDFLVAKLAYRMMGYKIHFS